MLNHTCPHSSSASCAQGARLVRASKLKAIFLFVAPPSTEELERRLRGRGTETDEAIALRMKNAKDEIARWALLLLRMQERQSAGCTVLGVPSRTRPS